MAVTTDSASVIDQVRAYWNRRPCNVRHSTSPVGSKEYFDEVEARKYFVEPHIPAFADFARWKGKKVLEIGCGIGTDSINFARAGADVTVVDLSDESLQLCETRFDVFGLKAHLPGRRGGAQQGGAGREVRPHLFVWSHPSHPA